jgi:hypothetical protein
MFPDNTVLISFAIINRMDLLNRLANGNGTWCATVATECAQSARLRELASLDGAREIFGEPLFPDDAEYQDVQVLRDELAGPGDQPTSHLADDRDVTRLAARNGVKTADTWLLLRVASRKGWLDADTLWG